MLKTVHRWSGYWDGFWTWVVARLVSCQLSPSSLPGLAPQHCLGQPTQCILQCRVGQVLLFSGPCVWLTHTHTPRVSSTVLPRRGSGSILLTAVGGIQTRIGSALLLLDSQGQLTCATVNRVSSRVLSRRGVGPALPCAGAGEG